MALNIVVSNSIRVSPAGPSATDPVSQAMNIVSNFMDAKDIMNIYFEKFYNIPMDDIGFCTPGSSDYILSRNITIN